MKKIEVEVTVTRKVYITPHYIRVFFTGENIHLLKNTTIGVNNKILIPPKGINKVYFPEFDFDKMDWKPQSEEVRPMVRTYTHRGIDLVKNEIWIDFVIHGEEGIASSWAIHAKKGDLLGILMRDGKTDLYSKVANYLFVADATGIPVISTILESLPKGAKGTCIIEVYGEEDEQILSTEADIDFIWLYNKHPQQGSNLADKTKNISLPESNRFAYIAAESDTVKTIRKYLRNDKNWEKSEFYAYSYWKAGKSEDKSATERYKETEED